MTRKAILFAILLLGCFQPGFTTLPAQNTPQTEPLVRIGLNADAAGVVVRSTEEFSVQQQATRSARFSVVLTVDEKAASRVLTRDDLRYRISVELDGGRFLVLPWNTRIRLQPRTDSRDARLQVGDRSYRGAIEVIGNSRNSFTVVNELPLEQYLLGVVPNELSPTTFGQIEALKAQAVAARTYIVRNMGQYRRDNYDICDTDACQVYFGAGTEEALATRAVEETRGVIATYNDRPINALYSSTCGGRTESVENIFDEKLPYLVSTLCEYKHPEPKPFTASRVAEDYKQAVLTVAGVSNFTELRRFLGLAGTGEPPSGGLESLATFLRTNFYPNVKPITSDLDFMVEQGILRGSGTAVIPEVLFRLIEKKGAFEWQ